MQKIQTALITTALSCLLFTLSAQLAEPKEKRDKWGFFIEKEMKIDYKYDTVGSKRFGHYTVMQDGKWGLVDSVGVEAIACVYDTMLFTKEHGCIVSSNGMYGVVSVTNETLIPFAYQDIDYYTPDSVSLVKQDGRWGYLRGNLLRFDEDRLIFESPEKPALFTGCETNEINAKELRECAERKMLEFVFYNIRYPAYARENGIQGRVVVEFFISPEGKIVEPRTLRDVGGGCSEEALRVVRAMPDWKPAMQDGQNVWSRSILPIQFKLQ